MPSLMNNRIGIFGGAFDPPHRGHEKALLAFLSAVQPEKLYVIPSGTPPHKSLSRGAEDLHRYQMSRLAFESLSEKICVSDLEICSAEVSYTLLTVKKLKEIHPDGEFFLFVGTDQFLSFETWREPQTLLSLCTLCVMDRFSRQDAILAKKRELEDNFSALCLLLDEKPYIMSSTDIRQELKEKGYSFRLSPAVNAFISERGLYGVKEDKERKELLSRLQKELSNKRFQHTLSVEREVAELCCLLGAENERELRLAALYHDLTKEKSLAEQISLSEEFGFPLSSEDLQSPAVLHGITASLVAGREGILSHKAVLAIRNHTTGDEEMSLGEKILFFADYIEETRSYDVCRKMRRFFYEEMPEGEDDRRRHLDHCILKVMQETVKHLEENQKPIHPRTKRAVDFLGKEMK